MALDLDAELRALRQHFLARQLHLLCDRMHADRGTRLSRRRRGRHRLGSSWLRGDRLGRRLRNRGISVLAIGLTLGVALTITLAITLASATATTAATTTAPTAATIAFLAAFACFGTGLVVRRVVSVLGRCVFRRRPSRRACAVLTCAVLAILRLLRVQRIGDARLVLVDVGQILESSREDHRRRIGRGRLPATATTTAPAARLSVTACVRPTVGARLGLLILADLRRQACQRRHRQALRPLEVDIGATLVVCVEIHAVDRDRLADAHLDLLGEEILELDERAALLREEHGRDLRGAHHLDARDLRHVEDELDAADRIGRDRVGHADLAEALAVRALHVVRLPQARAHALARHLDDAELADLRDGRLGAVLLEVLAQPVLDLAAMLDRPHVDEVIHDHAAEVAQAQLSGDLVDRLLVGLERVRLAVARAARAPRVHVDGHERLGLVDHQRAARGERDLAGVDQVDLPLHVERVEDRHAAIPEQDLGGRARADDLEERLRAVECALAVAHDAVDGHVDRVADGAEKDVALRVQLAGCAHRVHALVHHLPQAGEVLRIARELGARGVEAGGAQDEAEALGQVERVEDLPHLAAALLVVDLARDADVVHVGHHHEQAARDRQVARDGRTLGAEALLEDLHRDLHAALERILDERARAARDLLADLLDRLLAVAAVAGEVLRVQVGDVEEAVGALAEVDERGLDRGLDVDDARLVDRADVGRGRGALGEELDELALLEDRDARLVAGHVVDDDELLGLLAAVGDERVVGIGLGLDGLDRCVEGGHRCARIGRGGLVGIGARLGGLCLKLRLFLGRELECGLVRGVGHGVTLGRELVGVGKAEARPGVVEELHLGRSVGIA